MAEDSGASGEATYVYAVSRGIGDSQVRDLTGVGGQPVRLIGHQGLTALVSTVALDDFGEEALHRNLEDMAWLEATARAHHTVVEAAGSVTATAPLRLATVYNNDERVHELLDERAEAFTEALSQVEGRLEWGVKAYADPEAFTTAGAAGETGDASATPSGSGAAYLQRRRSQRQSREDAGRAATARAEEIHAALEDVADASKRHPPQDQRLTGHSGWMILNGAYLVDGDRADDLRAIVTEFEGHHGIELELTGPWVPYSFADPGLES